MSLDEDLRRIVREEVRAALTELRAALPAPPPARDAAAPLTVEEVGERAGGVTAETVRRWIDSKRLRARRAGHRWVVRPEDLEQFLGWNADEGEKPPPPSDQHLMLVRRRLEQAGGRKK